MRIAEISLCAPDLVTQQEFYTGILGLPLVQATDTSFTVQAGETRLNFQPIKRGRALYHFAFAIPCNKFAQAEEWLKKRVPILGRGGKETFFWPEWNAASMYFYDANGNVVELITHYDLAVQASGEFGPQDLLYVSEISLVVDDVPMRIGRLKAKLGLETYRCCEDTCALLGDIHGLFTVVQAGYLWFPTRNKEALVTPVCVKLDGRQEQHLRFSPFPYTIDVVPTIS
ncbi:hypothetical protein EPA93_11435 [Ktedonosporobacter rubrisoli]|uniref:VOC domain-containing protein n=1 Tax=Ktedonosporobacter rubrisoli TaxID=2509675 RepID=A0A4V0YYK9_KTERU|nr:hypothetical protein [Ktedonosporobacter rubrisoli]QBD76581.1 hypothetical protein EPA93_11435 [Ktedonosporobacter rubrisoli]